MSLNFVVKSQSCYIDNIIPYSQTESQYCWVSVIQMMRKYHTPLLKAQSDCDIFIESSNYDTLSLNYCQVNNTLKTTCTNAAAASNRFYPFLNWCLPNRNMKDYMTFKEIQSQINIGKPFVVSIGYGNDKNDHYLLGKGYDVYKLYKLIKMRWSNLGAQLIP